GVPDTVKKLAMSGRKKSMELVRMPTPLATATHKLLSELTGSIYNVAGSKAANMFQPLADIPTERNPIRALRSLTADIKIGLGSIPAFAMQLSAYVNIAAFEPKYVAAATRANMLHLYSRFMPDHVDHLDKIASMNLRGITGQAAMRPGHFKALWNGLNKSDFGRVGKEHAFQDIALRDR